MALEVKIYSKKCLEILFEDKTTESQAYHSQVF